MSAIPKASAKTPTVNAWIGARYAECGRMLLVMESAYGEARQHDDVEWWINGGSDATFSRLHSVLALPGESRRGLFDRLACMNVIEHSVGPDSSHKARPRDFRIGAATLRARLEILRPRGVWLASKASAPYATPVLQQFGAPFVITAHPVDRRNIGDEELREAFRKTLAAIRGALV